ncbi:MAG: hypothetical protein COA50_15185 [Flavobacteriaceae bacterium]|nr:MAG: hypothetical protein COA50_15185 [Flavobacteriaceae bacterium]
MSTTSSNICQNCNTKNELPFKYCPNCGQKNTDGKITFSELWSEFQDSVLNIESRTWRTLKNLFIPGKLTLEYFSGKHRRYLHPLRLLIVTSVLVIIAMSFQDFQSATNHNYNVKERILKNYERQRLYQIIGNIADSTNTIFPEQQTEIITDTILTMFKDSLLSLLSKHKYGDRYRDSIDLNRYAGFGSEHTEKISKYDFLNKNEDELAAIYKKDAGSLERLVFKQKAKYIKDEAQLTAAIIEHTTWAALLMMPCLALVLYLLNIRHDYYYIEHLIFTFHLHAFSFLVLAILITGLNIFPWWTFLMFMVIIWIYVFVSMWKVYRQSVGKTLFKFLILSISYGGLFILFLFGTIIFTFFLL